MTKQDQLRAILRDIQVTKGYVTVQGCSALQQAKNYACGLLVKSPMTMDKWLSSGKYAQDIPDNELKLLDLLWNKSKAEF